MANQRTIKRGLRRLERIETWQLLVLLLLVGFVTATFLRLNNVGMIERRSAVLVADKQGDVQEVTDRLYELQVYSAQHMNASTGDIYLQGQYNRDSQAIIDQAMAKQTPATSYAIQAYDICKQSFSTWSEQAVDCVSNEVAKLTPRSDTGTVHVTFPNPALYKYNYLSPTWTPDFAGFSLLVTYALIVVVALRIIAWIILRILLKIHYRHS